MNLAEAFVHAARHVADTVRCSSGSAFSAWKSRARALFFRADAAVAPDPGDPRPGAIASGIAAAMKKAALEGTPVRFCVGSIPGVRTTVALLSSPCKCRVELDAAGDRQAEATMRGEKNVPAFSLGRQKSVVSVCGDDLRLVFFPGSTSDPRLKVEWR